MFRIKIRTRRKKDLRIWFRSGRDMAKTWCCQGLFQKPGTCRVSPWVRWFPLGPGIFWNGYRGHGNAWKFLWELSKFIELSNVFKTRHVCEIDRKLCSFFPPHLLAVEALVFGGPELFSVSEVSGS